VLVVWFNHLVYLNVACLFVIVCLVVVVVVYFGYIEWLLF